jgi:hypothetical protein
VLSVCQTAVQYVVLSGLWGFAQVARKSFASRSQVVVFEQNMSESGEMTGRLADRKHTRAPFRTSAPPHFASAHRESGHFAPALPRFVILLPRRGRAQNMPESSESMGRLADRKHTRAPFRTSVPPHFASAQRESGHLLPRPSRLRSLLPRRGRAGATGDARSPLTFTRARGGGYK